MAGNPATVEQIDTLQKAKSVIKTLKKSKVVFLDCKVTDSEQLSLVQACTWDKKVYVFDILSEPAIMHHSGLLELLDDVYVVKVVHDCGWKCATFFNLYGVDILPMFDIQIAQRALDAKKKKEIMSRTKALTLRDMCTPPEGPTHLDKDKENEVNKGPDFWSSRPMTRKMLTFAAMDVTPLVPLYAILKTRLAGSGYENHFRNMCNECRWSKINKEKAKRFRVQREICELLEILYVKPNYPLSKQQKKMLQR